jgi:hypothetical protein
MLRQIESDGARIVSGHFRSVSQISEKPDRNVQTSDLQIFQSFFIFQIIFEFVKTSNQKPFKSL